MKKLLSGIGIGLLVVLAGCGKTTSGSYVIAGVDSTLALKGETVYLENYDSKEKLDSSVVSENGTLELKGKTDTVIPAALTVHGKRLAVFVLEPGDMTLDLAQSVVEGTPLNEKNAGLVLKADSLYADYAEKVTALNESEQDADAIVRQTLELREERNKQITGLYRAAFEKNKDNAVGYLAFVQLASGWNKEQLDAALAAVPEWFRNSVRAKRYVAAQANMEKTAPGKMFTDFEVTTGEGKQVKLSDYVGKGEYVLVDFWASWCGPCMREMPGLKEIHSKYDGKGLTVLGVAVWDDPEDTLNAVNNFQLPWDVITNAQSVPTDLYGIMTIPHVIMFAPDGTIEFRGLLGSELHKKVDEVMSRNPKK